MSFYTPTPEQLRKLSDPWTACYSGGKDSTSLVVWVEWLRRTGQISVLAPRLVQSDTTVEYPLLQAISRDLTAVLRESGWQCVLVEPDVQQKLYCRIFGIGVMPVHPGLRRLRWCTRSTKVDPMKRWHGQHSSGLMLTGLRMGESAMRDKKLKAVSCAAGGECGIPQQSSQTYSPILHWATCHVIDWLSGLVVREVAAMMADVFSVTRKLVEIYDVRVDKDVFEWADPTVTAARFGCIGCPAITAGRKATAADISRNGADSPLNELYEVWHEARLAANRCYRVGHVKAGTSLYGYGPIRLEARKRLFGRVMDIQRRAGVTLITLEDEAFIRQCWVEKRYPKGWSAADEATMPPEELPLFST